MMQPEHETEEKEVTAEDQAHINEFSRLNAKFHEIEEDLKVKQEELVNLQDSSNEVWIPEEQQEPFRRCCQTPKLARWGAD
jgi:prefoldin subunit 4